MSGILSAVFPYDAIVLISYGGPYGEEDVLPFMRNTTKGTGISDERLLAVSGHYSLFGGVSPINECNVQLCEEISKRLADVGVHVPVRVGNRNWKPFIKDTLEELIDEGARSILTIFTSAYSSYSGCRQYRENISDALEEISRTRDISSLSIDRVRPYANTEGFVQANVQATLDAWGRLMDRPGITGENARVVAVTHSIPLSMARSSGPQIARMMPERHTLWDDDGLPPVHNVASRMGNALNMYALSGMLDDTALQNALGPGWSYMAQHLAVGGAIMTHVSRALDTYMPWDLAFCSRSGSPRTPWLEPDINDHLEYLAEEEGVKGVVVAPIGFISDHMEVVYDLDTEAHATARDCGLAFERARTAGTSDVFLTQIVDLIMERASIKQSGEMPKNLPVAAGTYPALGENCGPYCCQYPQEKSKNASRSQAEDTYASQGISDIHDDSQRTTENSKPSHEEHPKEHVHCNSDEQKNIQGGIMDKLQHGAKTPGHGHGGKQTFIPAPDISHDPRDWVVDPEVVNSEDHYSLHMVFKRVSLVPRGESERVAWAKKLQEVVEKTGVEIRGWYDVAGFRSDADLMCWVLADSAEKCQAAFHAVANFGQGGVFEPVWSAMSRHIPAEFNRIHLPACFGGWAPRKYAAVYPFVRSLDWYYLPEARRSAILREHGMNANSYNDVPISTLAAFALGDWEWAITIEGDELERVMGVLRKQRGVEARLFVREDTPFYTGVRMEITQWFEAQPFA